MDIRVVSSGEGELEVLREKRPQDQGGHLQRRMETKEYLRISRSKSCLRRLRDVW